MARRRRTPIPDLTGKTFVVTGANSGLGFETALALAGKGAQVVLACRNPARADEAVTAIRTQHPGADLEIRALDLSSLASIRDFAKGVLDAHSQLHGLCNNAGVMALPYRKTADGFEMQFGTNHLGHFALTGLLLPPLLAVRESRVVSVSSTAHKPGRIHFDDLQWERRYRKWGAYAQSKLANLLFAFELHRKLEAAGRCTLSVAAHPGYSATNLQFAGPRMAGSRLVESISSLGNFLLAQDAAHGALPTLHAAAAPGVRGGEYFGPDGIGELRGQATRVEGSARSQDEAVAARLWKVSEELTGVSYDAL